MNTLEQRLKSGQLSFEELKTRATDRRSVVAELKKKGWYIQQASNYDISTRQESVPKPTNASRSDPEMRMYLYLSGLAGGRFRIQLFVSDVRTGRNLFSVDYNSIPTMKDAGKRAARAYVAR